MLAEQELSATVMISDLNEFRFFERLTDFRWRLLLLFFLGANRILTPCFFWCTPRCKSWWYIGVRFKEGQYKCSTTMRERKKKSYNHTHSLTLSSFPLLSALFFSSLWQWALLRLRVSFSWRLEEIYIEKGGNSSGGSSGSYFWCTSSPCKGEGKIADAFMYWDFRVVLIAASADLGSKRFIVLPPPPFSLKKKILYSHLPVWCNHDIMRKSMSTHLHASQPCDCLPLAVSTGLPVRRRSCSPQWRVHQSLCMSNACIYVSTYSGHIRPHQSRSSDISALCCRWRDCLESG